MIIRYLFETFTLVTYSLNLQIHHWDVICKMLTVSFTFPMCSFPSEHSMTEQDRQLFRLFGNEKFVGKWNSKFTRWCMNSGWELGLLHYKQTEANWLTEWYKRAKLVGILEVSEFFMFILCSHIFIDWFKNINCDSLNRETTKRCNVEEVLLIRIANMVLMPKGIITHQYMQLWYPPIDTFDYLNRMCASLNMYKG